MLLDLCIDLQHIPFGSLEEPCTVSILPTTRLVEDLRALSERLRVADIHLSG